MIKTNNRHTNDTLKIVLSYPPTGKEQIKNQYYDPADGTIAVSDKTS